MQGTAKQSQPWSGLSYQIGGLSSRCGGCPREEIQLDRVRCGSYGCGTAYQAGTDPIKGAVLYLAKGPGWKSGTLVFLPFRKTRVNCIKHLHRRGAIPLSQAFFSSREYTSVRRCLSKGNCSRTSSTLDMSSSVTHTPAFSSIWLTTSPQGSVMMLCPQET